MGHPVDRIQKIDMVSSFIGLSAIVLIAIASDRVALGGSSIWAAVMMSASVIPLLWSLGCLAQIRKIGRFRAFLYFFIGCGVLWMGFNAGGRAVFFR